MTEEENAELIRQVAEIKESWWFFPNYVFVIGALISIFCVAYFGNIIIQIIGTLVIIYCIGQLNYRAGLIYGYMRSYEDNLIDTKDDSFE